MQKVMLIVNAHAGAVSSRTRAVITKALAADFKLETVDTAARSHATELAHDAVDRGFDAVLAFGGDGTVNETAQALVHTNTSLGILPGGSTNVMARSLGVPAQPVEATAFLAERLRTGASRRIPVGRVGDRYFLFSGGIGLDAEVVRRVELNPEGKRQYGRWLWLAHALRAGLGEYRGADPFITLRVEGAEPTRAVTVVVQNARPFTYFGARPIDTCPLARLDGGFDVVAFERLRGVTIPNLVVSLFGSGSHIDWRSVSYHHDVRSAVIRADRPLPVQVDGDFIGHWDQAEWTSLPSALNLLI